MATTITIDPVTRIEGHLKIEVTVDSVGGKDQVIDAKSAGTMFRGFEKLLLNRDPRDASYYTQRICGVCPVSHAMAASMNLEDAFNVTPPTNGRILRNLVLGANFIQSHVLHFYHLAALDYIDTTGILDVAPWSPRWVTPDMVTGDTAQTLVNHYVEALNIRRKAHRMGAIFGGKLPCVSTFVVGGNTEGVTVDAIQQFRALLDQIRAFVDNTFVPDTLAVAGAFPEYYTFGQGSGKLMAYGVFDLDSSGNSRLLNRGRYDGNTVNSVDVSQITEYVSHSWYTAASGGMNPATGVTEPDPDKAGAYSYVKAPRYVNEVYEAGPLARMWVNGDYTNGISAMDRIAARALETKKIADAMDGWLNELNVGGATYQPNSVPSSATGIGLTEAPRGALAHWIDVNASKISRYQVLTPTAWNASPKDDLNQPGPIEQALIGTPINDMTKPVELLRIVHSFDPCLACSVHMVRPGKRVAESSFIVRPGVG